MTGGQVLAEMLKLAEIRHYGMGGFQLPPFYEGCRALGLKHLLSQPSIVRLLRQPRGD